MQATSSARTAGRPCSVCSHPEREQIEAAIIAGTTFRAISRAHGLGGHDAIRRHTANHLSPEVQQALNATGSPAASLFTERLAEIADDLRDAREQAAERGDASTLARVASAEARVILATTERFGVDAESLAAEVARGHAVFRALVFAAKHNPAAGRLISQGLRYYDAATDADELDRQLTEREITR